jgi:hypothetical protein
MRPGHAKLKQFFGLSALVLDSSTQLFGYALVARYDISSGQIDTMQVVSDPNTLRFPLVTTVKATPPAELSSSLYKSMR